MRRIIADFIPVRLFRSELMKLILEADVRIQRVGSDRKSSILGQNLSERSSTDLTEATAIFIRGIWLVEHDALLALMPFQVLAPYKNDGAGPNFSTPRTMTRAHH